MKLKHLFLAAVLLIAYKASSQVYGASNFTMVSHIDPETGTPGSVRYSGCWGWYQSAKNKEYAIACSSSGTYWVDITSPATPTVSSYRQGALTGCTWREVKTYQNYCYVISDDNGTNSFQIFDMQYLPDSVHKVYDSQSLFNRGHALWIDGNKMYIASVTSANNNYSSLNVYSLANPATPTLLRRLDQDYPQISQVHDTYVRHDTVFASCAFQGLHVYKFTAANTFSLMGSLTNYPSSGYNHSSALTPNGQTLVFLDEVPAGLPVKVADISNISNIQVMSTTNQYPQTTPHNPFMLNNSLCLVSAYQDGLQLFDISNPSTPVLAGYFDTYPQAGGNNNTYTSGHDYDGQWGCFPYYPSKHVFALDRNNGIFILKSHLYQNASVVTAAFTVPSSSPCVGSSLNITNNSIGATNYTWTFPGGISFSPNAQNLNVTYPSPGIYTITLIASNPNTSSTVSQTISVVNSNVSSVASSTNASCSSCNTGIASVTVTGGTAPYSYTWMPSGGNAAIATNLLPGCYTVKSQDVNGCEAFISTCLSFFTGLEDLANSTSLLVYPNPAQHILNIEYPSSTFNYSIYNKLGQVMASSKNNQNKAVVSLDEFSKGIYLLEVEIGKEKKTQKIIIE